MTSAVAEREVTTDVVEVEQEVAPVKEQASGYLAIDVRRLSDALNLVKTTAARRSSLPILSCVRMTAAGGYLVLETTDLELGMSVRVAAIGEFDACVMVDTLSKMATGSGMMRFAITSDTTIEVTVGKVKAVIERWLPEEFPLLPLLKDPTTVNLSRADLTEIAALRPFVSGDQSSPNLQAIRVAGNAAAATDTHRLGMTTLKTELPEMLLPERTISLLDKLVPADSIMDIITKVTKAHVQFEYANIVLFSRLVEGMFPNCEKVLHTEFHSIMELASAELLDAIKLIAPASKADDNRLRIIPTDGGLNVSATATDKSLSLSCEVNTVATGEPVHQRFNSTYLSQGIKFLAARQITLKQQASSDTGMTMVEGGRIYVVMPWPWED